MAGLSNEKFQDTDQEEFEYVKLPPGPNKLLKHYESLQCELELDYEILSVTELFGEGPSEENKQNNIRLDKIKGEYWSDYAQNIIDYTKNGGHYHILTQLLDYGLGRLKTCDTNIKMVDSFRIVDNCEVSMINYKRLGHTPSDEVSWTEINLALVEATTLLCILSDRIEVRYKNFFPVPHDSKSFIIDLSDQRVLPLYGEGKFSQFKNKEFDDALVAFLDCLSQLNAGIKKETPHQNLPHAIENDKLIDPVNDAKYTIRLQNAKNAKHWSRAVIFMMNNMKFLVKWVTLYAHKLEEFTMADWRDIYLQRDQ